MFQRLIIYLILITFFFSSLGFMPEVYAQTPLNLPAPGGMVSRSASFTPLELKGIQVYQDKPFRFDFLVDKGNSGLQGEALKEEIIQLSKYFLTCLTVPEKDLWVNLSPYEKNRIAAQGFGVTEMGKTLLEQDYLLKQIMASLSYPENRIGRDFWQKIYLKAQELYGTTNISINSFNKVWILPQSAQVYINGNGAFVTESQLDVMLETDYTSLKKNLSVQDNSEQAQVYAQIVREVLLPALRKEVNEGKNFAPVRQVYKAMILATWYKKHLKDSVLAQAYVGKNKVMGVDVEDKEIKEKIFQQYLKAYKKYAYNYIREDFDPLSQTTIPRKYVSGGMDFAKFGLVGNTVYKETFSSPQGKSFLGDDLAMATIDLAQTGAEGAIEPLISQRLSSDAAMVIKGRLWRILALPIVLGLSAISANTLKAEQDSNTGSGVTPISQNQVFETKIKEIEVKREDLRTQISEHGKQLRDLHGQLSAIDNQADQLAKEKNWSLSDATVVDARFDEPTPILRAKVVYEKDGEVTGVEPGPILGKVRNANSLDSLQTEQVWRGFLYKQMGKETVSKVETLKERVGFVSSETNALTQQARALDKEKQDIKAAWEVFKAAQANVSAATGGNPPPPPPPSDETSVWRIVDYFALGIAGLVVTTALGSGLFRRKILNGKHSRVPTSSVAVSAAPALGERIFIGGRPNKSPAPASPEELRRLVDEPIQIVPEPSKLTIGGRPNRSPAPATEAELLANSQGRNLNFQNVEDPQEKEEVKEIEEGLVQMDRLSMGAAALTSACVFGTDPVAMGVMTASMAFSPYFTRIIHGVQKFFHELTHTGTALVQSPNKRKKIITRKNLSGHYSFTDWLKLFTPFKQPSKNLGVNVPLTEKQKKWNHRFTFGVSTVIAAGSFLLTVKMGLSAPFLSPVLIAALGLIRGSWETDIKNPSKKGQNMECGNTVVIFFPRLRKLGEILTKYHFVPQFVREGLKNSRRISKKRGDQGSGREVFVHDPESNEQEARIARALKEKRGDDLGDDIEKKLDREVEKAIAEGKEPSPNVQVVHGHDRFGTQGEPTEEAVHPHDVKEIRETDDFENGEFVTDTRVLQTVITENGDFDAEIRNPQDPDDRMPTGFLREYYPRLFHMKKAVRRTNSEHPEGYMDYLPGGDAPVIPYAIQFRDNQGDWWSSARYAYEMIMNPKHNLNHLLSKEDYELLRVTLKEILKENNDVLRPDWTSPAKGFHDLWVTMDQAEDKTLGLKSQYGALERLRADIRKTFREALITESPLGKLLQRWQILHPEDFDKRLEQFVEVTVKRYFTADIEVATREFNEVLEGVVAVPVRSTKYPNTIILLANGQGLVLGFGKDPETGDDFMAVNSEMTALMTQFGEAGTLKKLLILNSMPPGTQVIITTDPENKTMNVRLYSFQKGDFLDEDELNEWMMELDPRKNKYFKPVLDQEPETAPQEDIDSITQIVATTQATMKDKESFLRQSTEDQSDKLASRWIESYIKENSLFYKNSQEFFKRRLYYAAEKCQGAQCSEEEARRRRALVMTAFDHDKRVLTYLQAKMDHVIVPVADDLFNRIASKDFDDADLYAEVLRLDTVLERNLGEVSDQLAEAIIGHNENFLKGLKDSEIKLTGGADDESLPKEMSFGSGDTVWFVAGMEDSLWLGSENFKDMVHDFFPAMPMATTSLNKALDVSPHDQHGVGRRTTNMLVSKSGATSPGVNLIPRLQEINDDNIFCMTSRVDTLMGMALGQKFHKKAPFLKRIMPTGNYRASEANSASEAELLAAQIEVVIFHVRRFKELFPHHKPWGLDISDEDVIKLDEWKKNMLLQAARITGKDENKKDVDSPIHKRILSKGKIFGRMLTETPVVNAAYRLFTLGIFWWGGPLTAIANACGLPPEGLGQYVMRTLDWGLANLMPWILTTFVYRQWSGRVQKYARLGPPSLSIGDTPAAHQVTELTVTKRGALAPDSMDTDVHGANPRDSFGTRLLHRLRRGAVELFWIPSDPRDREETELTVGQSNVRTSLWHKFYGKVSGNLFSFLKKMRAGPEIFTFSYGDVNPDLTHHHMDLGPDPTKGASKSLRNFHEHSFALFDRLTAYNVFFHEAYDRATRWGKFRIWIQGTTYSMMGILSTPSPRSKGKRPIGSESDKFLKPTPRQPGEGSSNGKKDKAQLVEVTKSLKGGIDMDSQFLKLDEQGNTNRISKIFDGQLVSIEGLRPQVSMIVPVTPEMLQTLLGPGYLN